MCCTVSRSARLRTRGGDKPWPDRAGLAWVRSEPWPGPGLALTYATANLYYALACLTQVVRGPDPGLPWPWP
jgi:hypothetical protein